jgi:hypothetical protein
MGSNHTHAYIFIYSTAFYAYIPTIAQPKRLHKQLNTLGPANVEQPRPEKAQIEAIHAWIPIYLFLAVGVTPTSTQPELCSGSSLYPR